MQSMPCCRLLYDDVERGQLCICEIVSVCVYMCVCVARSVPILALVLI